MTDQIGLADLDAERAVLGALILDGDDSRVSYPVRELLPSPECFALAAHREIFKALTQLIDNGTAIDQLTVRDTLATMKSLDASGGLAYLASLADEVPTAANATHHAKIVRDWSNRRAVATQGERLARLAADRELPPTDLLTQAIGDLTATAMATSRHRPPSWAGAIFDVQAAIESHAKSERSLFGVPTGFAALDRMTMGFVPGDLAILAARPSMGKTSLALRMARNAAVAAYRHTPDDAPVPATIIVSLEMSQDTLITRLLAAEAEVPIRSLLQTRRLTDGHMAQIAEASTRLSKLPIRILDRASADLGTPGQIRLAVQHWMATARQPVGLVVVDYVQLLHADRDSENRNIEMGEVSNRLKQMGQELGFPVLVLAQLNRESEKAGRAPRMSDLRDSGELEQNADLIMLLHVGKPEEWQEHRVDLLLDKNRNGETGVASLHFDKYTQRWTGWQRVPGDERVAA